MTTRQQWIDTKAWETQDTNNTNYPQKKFRLRTVSKNILLEGLNWSHGTIPKLDLYKCSSIYFQIHNAYFCHTDAAGFLWKVTLHFWASLQHFNPHKSCFLLYTTSVRFCSVRLQNILLWFECNWKLLHQKQNIWNWFVLLIRVVNYIRYIWFESK